MCAGSANRKRPRAEGFPVSADGCYYTCRDLNPCSGHWAPSTPLPSRSLQSPPLSLGAFLGQRWGMGRGRLGEDFSDFQPPPASGDGCQGTGWRQAKDGWPQKPRLSSSAETRAGSNGRQPPAAANFIFCHN